MSLKYARTCITSLGFQSIKHMWDACFDNVPSTIELLKPELRLTFRHLDNEDVLRLTGTGGPTTHRNADEGDLDSMYEDWKRNNIDVRTAPLAIDPVVSSAQSQAEFARAQEALQATLRVDVGPTIRATSPVFLGDFVLVFSAGWAGVTLASIANIIGQQSPYSASISCTAILFDHKPNAEVSGLFGTFKQMTRLDGQKRGQVRVQIDRSNIKVYNVKLSSKKFLTLPSLRVLAIAVPDYPLPDLKDIPESHLDEKGQREGRKTTRAAQRTSGSRAAPSRLRRGARIQRQVDSSSDESSDEDEEDSDDDEEDEEEEEDDKEEEYIDSSDGGENNEGRSAAGADA